MSLWTPSGEHPVDRQGTGAPPGGPAGGPAGAGSGPGGGPGGGPGPRTEPEGPRADQPAPDVEELRRQLADAPADMVVANHCYGLFELAAVYLSQSPPRLEPARLAIDALGCLVDGLGVRLGDAHHELAEALAQIRLAFVQITAAASAPPANGQVADQTGASPA